MNIRITEHKIQMERLDPDSAITQNYLQTM